MYVCVLHNNHQFEHTKHGTYVHAHIHIKLFPAYQFLHETVLMAGKATFLPDGGAGWGGGWGRGGGTTDR